MEKSKVSNTEVMEIEEEKQSLTDKLKEDKRNLENIYWDNIFTLNNKLRDIQRACSHTFGEWSGCSRMEERYCTKCNYMELERYD